MLLWGRKKRAQEIEREKMARLEQAEGDCADLVSRAGVAIKTLGDRQVRNHWQESIAQMIQGGTTS